MIPNTPPISGHIYPAMTLLSDTMGGDGYLPVRAAAAVAHLPAVSPEAFIDDMAALADSETRHSGR